MDNSKSYNIYLIIGIILIGFISRILPHAPNFTAIGAIALFGGNYIKNKSLKYIIPITALFLSDIILLYILETPSPSFLIQVSVYVSFLLIVLMGNNFIQSNKPRSIITTSLGASSLFFILSNFAVWLNGYYGYNLSGLINCYIMAIPFFGNTILADLTYCGILFGTYEYLKLSTPKLAKK